MGNKTPLYQVHLELGAKLVDFAGWDMPLHYGSQIEEHRRVRSGAGMFDVSHMAVNDIEGADAIPYLRRLLANSVDKLDSRGRAIYSCLLNAAAGVIDDVILYEFGGAFRLVSNAGTRGRVAAWLKEQTGKLRVSVRERNELALIAIQGPNAVNLTLPILPPPLRVPAESLRRYTACWDDECFVARTGYTGEDGFELIVPGGNVQDYWRRLQANGVSPAGLGARDTLRLEAGMNLYGAEMDETVTPLECGLGWTIDWAPRVPDFIGRASLAQQRQAGVKHRQAGLVLLGKGVLRAHQTVDLPGIGSGMTTSGGYAPALNRAIALARLPTGATDGAEARVEVRGQWLPARVVKTPFVQKGRSCLSDIN
jgi:aminomethyltransferase